MVKIFLCAVIVCMGLNAKLVKVPQEVSSIQAAINAAVNGDTVVVYPGTYFENINFKGKNIVLTSRFYESKDLQFIYTTIINGSQPVDTNAASVVLFITGEDSTAVLQGFTITGGKGTAWPDEHSPGTYTEGGGILSALASPKILFNLIINNEAIRTRAGIVSGGGGGIRVGDGNPTIANNVIMNNKGRYGGGVVMNYTGAVFRNNIVIGNSGGQDFGGGGIWINGTGPKPKYLENNTIVGNQSLTDGGGLLFLDISATATVRNNIIWGNSAVSLPQISLRDGATITSSFNDFQDVSIGSGNLNISPDFSDSALFLLPQSPLVDQGDPLVSYNDQNDGVNALQPSRGTKRNDIGAYGGPFSTLLPTVSSTKIVLSHTAINFGKIKPDSLLKNKITLYNHGARSLLIDSVRFKNNTNGFLSTLHLPSSSIGVVSKDSIVIQWNPKTAQSLNDTILVFHRDLSVISPIKISIVGRSFQIDKIVPGIMYAASGTADSAKVYSIDTGTAVMNLKGKTGFAQLLSLRANPKTDELVALINSTTPQLARISSTTGESFLLPLVSISNPKGMAFRNDGSLIVGSFSGTLYSVNINTGAAIAIGSNSLRVAGLAFNPVNGTLWMSVRATGAGKDNIYKVNPFTAAATLVGATGFGIPTKDITFDSNGKLFGVIDTAGSQSYLIHIDTSNGKGTVIGGVGVKGIESIELRSFFLTGITSTEKNIPTEFSLFQNYPNPFNPTTTIGVSLKSSGTTSIKIYDILGKEVFTVVNKHLEAGDYAFRFNAGQLASGIYYYTLRNGNFIDTKKMLLLK